MIGHMIVQNVLHRPVRTAITLIGVAVEVTLVIIVVGLTSGLLTETAKRTEGVGADVMVQPPSASIFMAFSGAPMPIAIGAKLEELEYVQSVAPVLVQFNSVNGLDIVCGINVVRVEADLVVDLALLGIAQHVIGFRKLFELLFRLLVRIDVRMVFARKFAERLANFLRGGALLYAERGVIVFLLCGCHIRL